MSIRKRRIDLIHENIKNGCVTNEEVLKAIEIHSEHKIEADKFQTDVYNIMVGICEFCENK